MRRVSTSFSALLAALLVCATAIAEDHSKRIAITFDDAPRGPGASMDVERRTQMLIDALDRGGIPGAMFFATTGNMESRGEEGRQRLRRYAEAGHVIANHTHTHPSANGISADAFLADVERAKRLLIGFPNNLPYFRFPFLNEGDTPEKRDAIRAGLDAMGLKQGYITIDNYDWYLQALFDEAINAKRPINLDAWRDTYVEILLAAVAHYDRLAIDTLGRSPAHVLLLHENDLAALFIDDLADALREAGWTIVPTVEAYRDPMANELPDTMLLGQGRVAAFAAIAGIPGTALRHPLESRADLRALLVKRGMVGFADGAYLDASPPGLQPAVFAPGVISLEEQYEFGVTLSADGREVFFGVAIDGRGEIRQSRFEDGRWTTPITILSHPEYGYADPFLNRDATRLYFITGEPAPGEANTGKRNIGYVRRTREGWSAPTLLGAPVNSAADEFFVSFTDDGWLAFASNRHEPDGTNFDIYLTRDNGDGFTTPAVLEGPATTLAYEADPFIAPDGSYVVFSSTRRSGEGRRDLYVSFRTPDGAWSRAISLGQNINTEAIEFTPFVTRDGRFLFYSSNEDLYWVDAGVIEIARQQLQ